MKKESGFTLLELVIAISIFGILMLSFSQLLRSEIRLFNTTSEKEEVEYIARNAMMRVLDEIRINKYTIYTPSDSEGKNGGVYWIDPDTQAKMVLINMDPSPGILADLQANPGNVSPGIYYDQAQAKLWYCENGQVNLIADRIYDFSISPSPSDTNHLVRISVGVGDPNGEFYDLITWARLY